MHTKQQRAKTMLPRSASGLEASIGKRHRDNKEKSGWPEKRTEYMEQKINVL